MSEEKNDQQEIVTQARHHTESLNAAICDGTIAHHSYWAWYYAEKIAVPQQRAQVQAELEKVFKQKG
jgi:hypothetical protein